MVRVAGFEPAVFEFQTRRGRPDSPTPCYWLAWRESNPLETRYERGASAGLPQANKPYCIFIVASFDLMSIMIFVENKM